MKPRQINYREPQTQNEKCFFQKGNKKKEKRNEGKSLLDILRIKEVET